MKNVSLEWFDKFQDAMGYATILCKLGYGALITPNNERFQVSYLPKN